MIMGIFKFILFWIFLGIVMLVSWSVGSLLGNEITQSSPPPVNNPSTAVLFLSVCLFNSFLVSILIWSTRIYAGLTRWIAIVIFCFVIQFFLTQMETWFFANSLGIGLDQIASILIAGLFMVVVTITVGILLAPRMIRTDAQTL